MFQANVCWRNFSTDLFKLHEPLKLYLTFNCRSTWYLLALHACTVRACVHLNRAEHKLRVSAVRSLRRPPSFGRVETNSFGTSSQPLKSQDQLCRPTALASFRHFDTRLKSFSFTSFSDHLFYLELKFFIPDDNHCKVAHTVKETAL